MPSRLRSSAACSLMALPVGGRKIRFANGVWVDSSLSLKSSFKEVATSCFKAEANSVDFQNKAIEVVKEVNSWVENISAGLIKELLPPGSVNSKTRLVLGNALYFKGTWETKFYASETKESEFFLLDCSSIKVPFMTSKGMQYISSYDGFSVLSLPYKQSKDRRQSSLCIFLPDAIDGLWNLVEKLSSKAEFLDHHIPRREVFVRKFKLPKFKILFGFEASEVLKVLGLTLPFAGEGDLEGMVDSPVGLNLVVSSVFHKSFAEVNEEGTEAAASTTVMRGFASSYNLGPFDFVADHPFAFVIREDLTGAVLFTGHVLNPQLSGEEEKKEEKKKKKKQRKRKRKEDISQ